jgi:hypothetical protein
MKKGQGLPWCKACYGRGVKRDKASQRYVHCHCGRLVDSRGAKLLADQKRLDDRYETILTKGFDA